MTLLPGDQLWNRYRVERVAHELLEGAWLSPLHRARNSDEAARCLLVPLSTHASHPLSGILAALQSVDRPIVSGDAEAGAVWPLFGRVEFIGEAEQGGSALISASPSVPLPELLAKSGPFTPAQVLPLAIDLAAALDQFLKVGSVAEESRKARLPLLLSRLLNPGALSLADKNARLIPRLDLMEPSTRIAPPLWAEFSAPEIYRGEAATPAACVFGVARIAAYCLGCELPQAGEEIEQAYSMLAEWAAGKRDPAKEFLESPRAAKIPAEFSELLARALSKRASKRFATPAKLLTALEKLAVLPWAADAAGCEFCGFVLLDTAAACPCCAKLPLSALSKTALVAKPRKGTSIRTKAETEAAASAGSAKLAVTAIPAGMTLVPAGAFLSGERKTPRTLRGYAIDTLPVTEADYKNFLLATGKTARPGGPGSRGMSLDAHPVTGVSWHEASDYALFLEKRLPTVYEWEKAARGTDGRKFPFGNVFKPGCGRLRTAENQKNDDASTAPAGTHPDGASPYGVMDMAGNVLEWTSSARRAGTRLFRAVKGACYKDGSPELARCTSVQYLAADCDDLTLGFRCVKDLE